MHWMHVGEVIAVSVLDCVLGSVLSGAIVCAFVGLFSLCLFPTVGDLLILGRVCSSNAS